MKESVYGTRPRPNGGAELFAWLFMRYSGIVLLLLALGHLFIMHVFNSIHVIDYDFVAKRYIGWFWRIYDGTMLWLAVILVFSGIGYKISAAPMHMWTPDVYQGAPTPVTALFSVAPKAAGFALLIRFFVSAFSIPLNLEPGSPAIDTAARLAKRPPAAP